MWFREGVFNIDYVLKNQNNKNENTNTIKKIFYKF